MTDHHDDAGHADEHGHDFEHDFTPADDAGVPEITADDHGHDDVWDVPDDHHAGWDEPHHDEAVPEDAAAPVEVHDEVAPEHEEPPSNDEPVDLFPPQVDVGPLPEPVDGFPWVDSSSLGLIDAGPVGADTLVAAPEPHELAEYAAEELPPAVDPWDHLAESEDPATAALAKFYRPDQT